MTDYELKISSYGGLVAGARHYRGRVEGPYPESCHGSTTHHNWADDPLRGKVTCDEGHEIPRRVDWAVEAVWTEARYERWAAKHFEGDGPEQFLDQGELITTAIKRFKGETEHGWWEDNPVVGQPGDRLFMGHVPIDAEDIDEEWGRLMNQPAHGSVLVQIPAEAKDG